MSIELHPAPAEERHHWRRTLHILAHRDPRLRHHPGHCAGDGPCPVEPDPLGLVLLHAVAEHQLRRLPHRSSPDGQGAETPRLRLDEAGQQVRAEGGKRGRRRRRRRRCGAYRNERPQSQCGGVSVMFNLSCQLYTWYLFRLILVPGCYVN